VTGKDYSFTDGIELGKKIWNLDNVIWALQGRHRDMVQFAPYIYNIPLSYDHPSLREYLPARKDGKWEYLCFEGRFLDRDRFEEWKTKYYIWEGWDTNTGRPKRSTLEFLGLGRFADELEKNGEI
jgi:aldehyde:ferredoxin oxidoreductase